MPRRQRRYASDEPADKVLLVEGQDDQHVFWNLLERHGYQHGVTIQDGGGYENIRETLGPRLKATNEQRLGVVVDADIDFGNRWKSLRDVIARAGYIAVPEIPSVTGTIIEQEGKPTLGVWLMPDNQAPGMLEDFARLLLPPQDRLWSRAAQTVDAIPDDERLFSSQHRAKAHIHTWLAWQREPGRPIGQAIKIGFFDAETKAATHLVAWVQRLFDLSR